MYIHYTGYTLNNEPASALFFIYTLSTESSFCYKILDAYWTTLKSPTGFSELYYQLNLMGYSEYYTYINSPNIIFDSHKLPYLHIKFPISSPTFHDYDQLLNSED